MLSGILDRKRLLPKPRPYMGRKNRTPPPPRPFGRVLRSRTKTKMATMSQIVPARDANESLLHSCSPCTVPTRTAESKSRSDSMARRRHQTGRVIVRGKKPSVFVGRWREDVIQADGAIDRVERSMVLGTVSELKTKRIAQRLLDPILARINSFDYRPSKFITVEKFADAWETQVLTHRSRPA